MPPEQHSAWLKLRTNKELVAIIEADNGGGIHWDMVTDEELEEMCAGTFDYSKMRDELKRPRA